VSVLLAGDLALDGTLAEGWVELDGARLAAAAHGPPPREPDERLDGILSPGLCDLQVNGGGGHEVTDGAAALDAIDAIQLARGVTSYLPTLVSPDDETVERALPELAARMADPASPVVGVHVEGPFLSREQAGMHPVQRLRSPADGVPAWLEHPAVRLVTIAPELPGAVDLIGRLSDRGVAVSLGHSAASAEVATLAIDAGARLVTHVFNAMALMHPRAPGLAGVALTDERVHVAVIADGVHVHRPMLELMRRAVGARAVLVTDATPVTGAPAGRYEMAGVTIELGADGAAHTLDGTLAGSTLTLDRAARNWHEMTGATLAQALFAASQSPAQAARLWTGLRADLVLLDSAGMVRRAMRGGRWLDRPTHGEADRP
jgi:N-acetylglucosamine-6-phosphate deacetylase